MKFRVLAAHCESTRSGQMKITTKSHRNMHEYSCLAERVHVHTTSLTHRDDNVQVTTHRQCCDLTSTVSLEATKRTIFHERISASSSSYRHSPTQNQAVRVTRYECTVIYGNARYLAVPVFVVIGVILCLVDSCVRVVSLQSDTISHSNTTYVATQLAPYVIRSDSVRRK